MTENHPCAENAPQPLQVAQTAFDFAALRQVGRRQYVLRITLEQQDRFKPDFYEWLRDNLHVWEAFEIEADIHYNRGAKHWGARTIGEYLRRETAVRSSNDGDWKVNDHRWPDLARLYLALHPDRDGFFELRGRG